MQLKVEKQQKKNKSCILIFLMLNFMIIFSRNIICTSFILFIFQWIFKSINRFIGYSIDASKSIISIEQKDIGQK